MTVHHAWHWFIHHSASTVTPLTVEVNKIAHSSALLYFELLCAGIHVEVPWVAINIYKGLNLLNLLNLFNSGQWSNLCWGPWLINCWETVNVFIVGRHNIAAPPQCHIKPDSVCYTLLVQLWAMTSSESSKVPDMFSVLKKKKAFTHCQPHKWKVGIVFHTDH